MLCYLAKFQECIEGRLESTSHQVSFEIELERQKLTVNCETWVYNDCCCDTCPACQRFSSLAVFDSHLVDKDGSPKLFYEFDDFSRILRFIEDSSDLALFR